MNKNIKNIIKEKIELYNFKKIEVQHNIKKSIIQNNNIKNGIKIYSKLLIIKRSNNRVFLSRQHKVCISTGKRGGLTYGYSFSRYKIKKLILENKLNNTKKHNW